MINIQRPNRRHSLRHKAFPPAYATAGTRQTVRMKL